MARKRVRRQHYSIVLFSENISAHYAVLLGEAGGSNMKDGKGQFKEIYYDLCLSNLRSIGLFVAEP